MRILILLIIFITLPISAIAAGRIDSDASKSCYKKCKAVYGKKYRTYDEMKEHCLGKTDKFLTSLICCHYCAPEYIGKSEYSEPIKLDSSEVEEPTQYDSSEGVEPTQYDSSEVVEPTTSIEELEDKVNELEDTLNQLYMNNQ